jgi:hypothetical protein
MATAATWAVARSNKPQPTQGETMTNYKKIIAAVVAVVALGGATIATAAPAEAFDVRTARVNGI